MEQIDDLQYNGLRIIQKSGAFRYGTDGVLLANYAADKVKESPLWRRGKPVKFLDIGTGTGIVPILLCGKMDADAGRAAYEAVEIQPDMAEMAERSIKMNGQDGQITVTVGNILEVPYAKASFDVITMNPPYVRADSGIKSDISGVAKARHEIVCTQEDMIKRAGELLKSGGMLIMIDKSDRLTDALCAMREAGTEPREIVMVEPKKGAAPSLFLVTGIRGGGKNLRIAETIVIGG